MFQDDKLLLETRKWNTYLLMIEDEFASPIMQFDQERWKVMRKLFNRVNGWDEFNVGVNVNNSTQFKTKNHKFSITERNSRSLKWKRFSNMNLSMNLMVKGIEKDTSWTGYISPNTLCSVINYTVNVTKKPFYVCFVDFKKAFDKVSHVLLWQKLVNHSTADGKFINIIKSLYSKAKSCVRLNEGLTEFFPNNKGLDCKGCPYYRPYFLHYS